MSKANRIPTAYWQSEDDEVEAFGLCHQALTKCPITFHNATWDMQVIGRRWGFLPNLQDDTMVAQHCAFPGLLGGKIDPTTGRVDKRGSSLSLSFCSSMYCDYHAYWKDDGRVRGDEYDDDTFWRYNCEDCVRTFEVREALDGVLRASHLTAQYRFLMSLFGPVLKMMFRGIRVDKARAASLRQQIADMRRQQQEWLDTVLGYTLNVHSTNKGGQIQSLFYEDLQCQPVRSRKTGELSTDDEALDTIARRVPTLLPLVRAVQNIRSLDTNEANFIRPVLGGWKSTKEYVRPSGPRLLTCLNIPGVETFRFSSNETAFGEGLNMQNFTRPAED